MVPDNHYFLLENPECNYNVQPKIGQKMSLSLIYDEQGKNERQVNVFPFKSQLYSITKTRI